VLYFLRMANRLQRCIEKYRLNEIVDLQAESRMKEPLGRGPIMAPEVIDEFVRCDPSGENKYLDWMFFQAGGGQICIESMLSLWNGEGPEDSKSLRSLTKSDHVADCLSGDTTVAGVRTKMTLEEAEKNWSECEERSRYEFLVGDQDIVNEDGFGFCRYWPGKDRIYECVAEAVKMWHSALPKLKAENARGIKRYDVEGHVMLTKDGQNPCTFELDIYRGWSPDELSQPNAVYKNLSDLLRPLAGVRRGAVAKDVRFDIVYEDENVLAICPLTMGASLKFGSVKWCTSSRSEFERAFEGTGGVGSWRSYNARGLLVYLIWKRDMPAWLSKLALHIEKGNLGKLAPPWDMLGFYDVKNDSGGISYKDISQRIAQEHGAGYLFLGNEDKIQSSLEEQLCWNHRRPGSRAWATVAIGNSVLASLNSVLEALRAWAPKFDPSRVVIDYAK